MPFSVGSFYKTKVSTSGVRRELQRHAVYIPDAQLSDAEDLGEEDDAEMPDVAVEDTIPNLDSFGILDTELEDRDRLSDESDEEDDEMYEPTVGSANAKKGAEQKSAGIGRKCNRRWRKKEPAQVNSSFFGPSFPPPPEEEQTPLQYFLQFFDRQLISHIVGQTNLYSVQVNGSCIVTAQNEMEQFLGILILMGIIKYPQYRMYWSPGTRIPAVADVMPLARFEKIKRFFHLNNNAEMPKHGQENFDKLYKVRPMIESILLKCRALSPEESHSVDEQMIPTKARSSLRQYLPKKPHKWGMKVWARCGVSGMLYDFEIYTGKQAENKAFGKVGAVVTRLVEHLPRHVGHKVYFDNLFTNLNLVQHLKSEGIWSLGTVRSNRLEGAERLLKSKKDLEGEGRGSSDSCVDANSNTMVLRWLDNGLVQMVSSFIGNEEGGTVKRWSAKDKAKIDVPCPLIVIRYNKHMGGVDLCDMLMSLYRIKLGTRKWYMHIVYYCIGVAIVNAWLLYRRHCQQKGVEEKDMWSLLKFPTMIANALLASGKETPNRKRGRPSSSPGSSTLPQRKMHHSAAVPIPYDDVRLDKMDHFPLFTQSQQRCRLCSTGYTHVKCCKCKVALCLIKNRNCFLDFHTN